MESQRTSNGKQIKGYLSLLAILLVAVLIKRHYQINVEYINLKERVNYYYDNLSKYDSINDCEKIKEILTGLNSHLIIYNNKLKNHQRYNSVDSRGFKHSCL